jgi:hypothetical protein
MTDVPILNGTWTSARCPAGLPRWVEITEFLQNEKHRLHPRHHEFIDAMAKVWRRQFAPAQEQYLHALFLELEGRMTTCELCVFNCVFCAFLNPKVG